MRSVSGRGLAQLGVAGPALGRALAPVSGGWQAESVTAPFPPAPPPGRPEGAPGGERISLGKALVLLVVAVVVGVVCLQVGSRPTVDTGNASAATTTTTTAPSRPTTTTTTTAPNPAVKVLVANGGAVNGAAGFFTAKLDAKGWSTLTPTNATPVTASAVYYATGQQQPAEAIATSLGLASTVVKPLATSTPVEGVTGADVVVIVGPNLSSQVTSTTTTSTTTTTTAATTTSTATTASTTTGTTTTTTTTPTG